MQDWAYAEDGRPRYWPIDDYFMPGERKARFCGCEVAKQHHTLTQIAMGLLEEAVPPAEMMDVPGTEDELRRPMMLLIKAKAKK